MTSFLGHSCYLGLRKLRALVRQPWFIAISLAQPLVYLLLYSALFERIVELPGFEASSYLDFLAPGIVLMTAMFSGGWSGMSIISDLERGVVDRFLVSPVSRGALIAGPLIQQAVVTVIQSAILVGVALAIGADFPSGIGGIAVLVTIAIVLGTAFAGLSLGLAIVVRREESVVAAVQLLLMPLVFLSSVFIQRDLMPGWIQDVARFNPADWAVQAGREAVAANTDWSLVLSHGSSLVAFALACAALGTRGFRAYQRAV